MTELIKELIAFYKEKTKLPIVSTYVILLIIWNWDILSIYLFSSVNMEIRIYWIKYIVPGFWDHLFRILVPALISFTYPFITNYLMFCTDKWLNNSISDRMEILNERKIKTAKARYKIKEEELGTSDLKQLEAQIKELEGKRDSLTHSLQSANDQNEDLSDRMKLSIDAYNKLKKENETLRNNKRTVTNNPYLSRDITTSDEQISYLVEKYSRFIGMWRKETLNFFLKMEVNHVLSFNEVNLFKAEEIIMMVEDRILVRFEDKNKEALYVVTKIGEDFSVYLSNK